MVNACLIWSTLSVYDNHHVIRVVTADSPNHSFRILFITPDVNEGENLLAFLDYLTPSQRPKLSLIRHMTL